MLKKVLIGLAGLLLVLVIVIATRPSEFTVERSTTTAAPPSAPYALVADFHQWTKWSPFEKDAKMTREYSGPDAGVGAAYHWVSEAMGEGRMTITEAKPEERIVIRLEFIKPFAATNTATFTFAPEGAGTKVTWRMDGNNNFLAKAIHMVIDPDKMIGGMFQDGLAAMKTESEKTQKAALTTP